MKFVMFMRCMHFVEMIYKIILFIGLMTFLMFMRCMLFVEMIYKVILFMGLMKFAMFIHCMHFVKMIYKGALENTVITHNHPQSLTIIHNHPQSPITTQKMMHKHPQLATATYNQFPIWYFLNFWPSWMTKLTIFLKNKCYVYG